MAGGFLDLLCARQMASYRVRCRHVNNKLDTHWITLCPLTEQLRKMLFQPWSHCSEWSPFLLFKQKHRRPWFLSYFMTSKYPLPEVFSPLSAHLLQFPPASSCVVSARWDMLFGLIYNASPAPRHHVWQMTYFCADPHRALTWRGCVGVHAMVCKSVDVCLFVYKSWVAHMKKCDGDSV